MRYVLLLGLLGSGCTGTVENDDTAPPDDTDVGPADGQGALSGDCGDIDRDELTAATPYLFSNTLDFDAPFDETDLTEGGLEIYNAGNLGGSSIWSEVFAFEVLYRCEGATLEKTEGEIRYTDEAGKKTDLIVTIDGISTGVSVTRAFGWPPEAPYTDEQALDLLTDKLNDIALSSANASAENQWEKQILHILAYTPEHASTVEQVWSDLQDATKSDTVVVVTATEGDDEFMY